MTFGSGGWRRRGIFRKTSLPFLIFSTALITIAAAGSVTIINGSRASYAGALLQPYYENLNAPVTGCTAPCLTVDTQTAYPNNVGKLALDGTPQSGTWSAGTSFTITTVTTTNSFDVIIVWIATYLSGSSVTVSSISDSANKVTWQASARQSSVVCTAAQETTQVEWYGTTTSTLSSDTITVHLGGTPTAASGIEIGIAGANTNQPFDTATLPQTATSSCTGVAAAPTVSGVSTNNPNDFVFVGFGTHTSVTETAGAIAGTVGTLDKTVASAASVAVEHRIVSSVMSAASCAFNTATTRWGILCDAVVQASGSFSLPAGSSMYLWSPQFGSATSIAAGSLSLQLFADLPAPALDGSAVGTWASGSSFTLGSFSTTKTYDIILVSVQTYSSGTSVSVASVSDSLSAINWQISARKTLVSCSGTQESTKIEWYGIASSTVTTDTIKVTLSAVPTSASAIAYGVSGADTITPFDPSSNLPTTAVSSCTAASSSPSVSAVSTVADTDFVFSMFGGYTSLSETVGTLGGTAATMIQTVSGVGDSNAAEFVTTSTAQASVSCSFGTSTTYWSILCDAIMPARQTITVSYVTTNSAGTVQSTMIAGSTASISALYQPISLSSSAGSVPASGYLRVVITAPAGAALTVLWGNPKPTLFETETTVRT